MSTDLACLLIAKQARSVSTCDATLREHAGLIARQSPFVPTDGYPAS